MQLSRSVLLALLGAALTNAAPQTDAVQSSLVAELQVWVSSVQAVETVKNPAALATEVPALNSVINSITANPEFNALKTQPIAATLAPIALSASAVLASLGSGLAPAGGNGTATGAANATASTNGTSSTGSSNATLTMAPSYTTEPSATGAAPSSSTSNLAPAVTAGLSGVVAMGLLGVAALL